MVNHGKRRCLRGHAFSMYATYTEMIGALAEDVADIKNTLDRKVDREEFLGHEKRISVLERSAGNGV